MQHVSRTLDGLRSKIEIIAEAYIRRERARAAAQDEQRSGHDVRD